MYVKYVLIMLTLLGALVVVPPAAGEGNSSSDNSAASQPAEDIKAQARNILQRRCAQCHKNIPRLMSVVNPKAGLKNKLYAACANPHPKRAPKRRCTDEEVKTIGQWLMSLAKPASQPASEPAQ